MNTYIIVVCVVAAGLLVFIAIALWPKKKKAVRTTPPTARTFPQMAGKLSRNVMSDTETIILRGTVVFEYLGAHTKDIVGVNEVAVTLVPNVKPFFTVPMDAVTWIGSADKVKPFQPS